jgi:hypothetical protein
MREHIVTDETGTEMPGPNSDVPADVATSAQTTSFMTGIRGVIRILAYLALILVLAVIVSTAMHS